ncbi:hypothetical protein CAOG_007330 [Capsaspora owczarzaki ATCC 30864]|uniref:Galactosyltransferase N-terminal domain-containing protein n=2 Tax=Capsaspora owczarzaki (strain ATCC 30864) TaxID=595528 RepID=A0A0D2UR38_CAPO3|nr:hypothetical protein CAOG_007330 [Capsaspora owczarzaki ATCC 30864]
MYKPRVLLAAAALILLLVLIVSHASSDAHIREQLRVKQQHADELSDYVQQLAVEATSFTDESLPTPAQLCTNNTLTLAIVVPFRRRDEHLQVFLPWMRRHLLTEHAVRTQEWSKGKADPLKKPICRFAKFVVVEQADNLPFNRNWLLNIGARYAHETYAADVVALHDVDTLPMDGVSYLTVPPLPLQLSAELDRIGFIPASPHHTGGVNLLQYAQLVSVNGFSNELDDSAEGKNFFKRLQSVGWLHNAKVMNRPPVGEGRFFTLSSRFHNTHSKTIYDDSGLVKSIKGWFSNPLEDVVGPMQADGLSNARSNLKELVEVSEDTVLLRVVPQ